MKMKTKTSTPVTRIVYARLKNLGDFENARIEAEIHVPPGESVDKAMGKLRKWVDEQLEEIES